MKSFYRGFIRFGEILQPLLLLVIRLAAGAGFVFAGMGKLSNIEQTAAFFNDLHIPLSTFHAYLVGGVELIGGLMLILGLGARLAAAILAIVLVVAYLTAHFESVRMFLVNPGLVTQDSPFPFLFAMLVILAFGPGLFSIDAINKRWLFKS